MNFAQSFKLALKSLKTSKMRAFLTMLGIIIGVGAVIVILSLGNGMTNMMNSQFEKMGSNLIQVMTYGRGTGGTRDVDVEDLYELVDKYPQYLTGVTPYVSASAKVRYQTDDYDRTSVYGVSEAFFKEDTKGTMQGETLAEGRFLSYIDVDRHQNVCVIGDYLAQTAFRGDALGKTISLSGVPYTVIGVLSKSGDSSEGSADDVIYIPYENAQRMGTGTMMMGTGEMFLLTSTSRDTASAAKGIVENLSVLGLLHGDDLCGNDGCHEHHDEYHDDRTGGHRRHFPAGGRYRHYEHHAGVRHGTDKGDRHPKISGRQAEGHPGPVRH